LLQFGRLLWFCLQQYGRNTRRGRDFATQWSATWKKTGNALEGAIKNPELLKQVKNKYIAGMKKILKKGRVGEKVQDKFSYHKKTLKAIEPGVRYIRPACLLSGTKRHSTEFLRAVTWRKLSKFRKKGPLCAHRATLDRQTETCPPSYLF
jgi:hypothetical protein